MNERQQAEVGGSLFFLRRFLVAVDAAAQQLLVLRRRVVFTEKKCTRVFSSRGISIYSSLTALISIIK